MERGRLWHRRAGTERLAVKPFLSGGHSLQGNRLIAMDRFEVVRCGSPTLSQLVGRPTTKSL
jgi:hypothetical protein